MINAIRAHMAEFGIVAPRWGARVEQPGLYRRLSAQLRRLKEQILEFDRQIMAWHRSNETSRRLDAIPGVGPALATAGCKRRRSKSLPIGTELRSLDRARAEAATQAGAPHQSTRN